MPTNANPTPATKKSKIMANRRTAQFGFPRKANHCIDDSDTNKGCDSSEQQERGASGYVTSSQGFKAADSIRAQVRTYNEEPSPVKHRDHHGQTARPGGSCIARDLEP
jgi:hypothetical protein